MTWLVDTLIYTGLLIALVLVLRRPVARWFGPGMAYALWALPLLRLVLPPLVLPAPAQVEPVSQATVAGDALLVAASPVSPAVSPGIDPTLLVELAAASWLIGAVAFLAWRAAAYVAMRKLLLTQARPVGQSGPVRLVETPATQAPVAFGVIDKVVALPIGFMNQHNRFERDLAIAHELEHHAGRDLAVNLAMQPLLALHWFNPLAWMGWRALRRDQEAACDARVLAGGDALTRATYAKLITSFAQSPRLALAAPMACPVLGEKSIIHRLRSMTMTPPSEHRRLFGRALLGASVLALPLTASITYAASSDEAELPAAGDAAKPVAKKEHRIVIIEKKGGASVDDAALKTKVITRDGKTIVFKSDQDLTDAEIETKVAMALASVPEAPEPPEAPEAPDAPEAPEVHRVMIKRIHGPAGPGQIDFAALGLNGHGCDTTELRKVEVTSDEEGSPRHVKVAVCARTAAKAAMNEANAARLDAEAARAEALAQGAMTRKAALDGLRAARDSLARDKNLSDKIRAEVTRELDAEIQRLKNES